MHTRLGHELVSARSRHDHGINVDFVEQSAHYQYSRQNVKLLCLTNLALITGLDVPLDVVH